MHSDDCDPDKFDDYDLYNEALQAFYEQQSPALNFKQLRAIRNQWEKDYTKAKKLVWIRDKEDWTLVLKFVDAVDFEI